MKLSIDLFINTPGLLHEDQIAARSNLISLLGTDLKDWINHLLDFYQVPADGQKIEGEIEDGAFIKGRVYIAKGAKVEAGAYIQGPTYIGPDSEVRHAAYIRGVTYVGRGCVVGHTTEVKGSVFMDGAKAGHFAYVGDSILGRDVNLGAGTKLANLPINRTNIKFKDPITGQPVDSLLNKFGAILGDGAQTGCNAVLSPGTLLLPKTAVLPCVHYRGTLKSGWAT